jgi:membrane dipeptidase
VDWIDLHIDTLWRMRLAGLDPLADAASGGPQVPRLHVDAAGAQHVGLRAAVWATYVEAEHTGATGIAELLLRMGAGLRLPERSSGRLRIVRNGADLERCLEGEGHGMILGLEGAHPLMGSVEILGALHELGLRVLGLTWNDANPFAAGCAQEGPGDGGLTPLGHKLVREAHRLGLILDLAHASPRTLDDVLAMGGGPFFVSHTGCRALRDHRRNLADEQLRRVARAGGLVGITICPPFLTTEPTGATSAHVADHIVHAASVAGVTAVAWGSDFDGVESTPADLPDVRALPRVAEELERRGMAPDEIEAIAWRNAARLLRGALDSQRPAGDGREEVTGDGPH